MVLCTSQSHLYIDVHQKQELFREEYVLDYSWPSEAMGANAGTPLKKMFLSENVMFWGLRLSLGHFGQQVPESPVSQLQNSVSTFLYLLGSALYVKAH